MAYSTDDKHFQRLTEVVDHNYREQKRARDLHQWIIRHLMGDLYPTRYGSDAGPLTSMNLLSMAYRATSRHLISKSPRCAAATQIPQLKTWAENAEISTNKRILRSNAALTLREFVDQSMCSFGTLFTAPQYVGTPEGMKLDLTFRSIDRADYVYDLEATSLEYADIQGHKERMKIVDIQDCPIFDEECRMEVDASGAEDAPSDERTNFQRAYGRKNSLYDYAEIWCVYDAPRRKLIYFPRHQPNMRLAEIDWLGPREGPYLYLYYEKPPNHAQPIAPLMHLMTKHRAFNELDMKALHQQQAAKGVLGYTNAGKQDAENLIKAVVNQAILQENGAVRYFQVGGAAPDTVAMAEKQKRDFSYASSGIIDQFQQQGDTLGQERLLRGASNEMLDDMSGWSYQSMKKFCQNVFWFDNRDPDETTQMLSKPTGVKGINYQVQWTKQHRRFVQEYEFDVDVEPFSYVDRSPSSRLADLLGALQIYATFGDQAMAQGIMVDVEAVVRHIAKAKNLPELYECLILNQDPERLNQLLGSRGNSGAEPPTVGKPNGQYTRRSESDGAGADMELLRMFGKGGDQGLAA